MYMTTKDIYIHKKMFTESVKSLQGNILWCTHDYKDIKSIKIIDTDVP